MKTAQDLLLHHRGPVGVVASRPDGRLLATGSWDQTAHLWDVPEPVPGDPERVRL